MALGVCDSVVDNNGRELLQHGTAGFPVACYHDDLEKNEVPWHWHEEWEAAVITEGCAVVTAGNRKYTIHAGEGFFINSEVLHDARKTGLSNCRFHSIVFKPGLVGGSMDSIYFQNYVHPLLTNHALESLFLSPAVPWQTQALKTIEEAWQYCATEPDGYEFKVRDALSELVFLLQNNLPSDSQIPSAKAMRNGQRIKEMLTFIHNHFNEELNTAMIAASVSVSESECLRCFRNTIGTTPIQYLRRYRIQRACRMLQTTPALIADIAHVCGFQDLSYFTKTFREIKGCTPGEFRKSSRLSADENSDSY